MCTIVILRRSTHDWPIILAALRDEMMDRPWQAPGRHWPDRNEVIAGLDEQAGGSWMGLNDSAVIACMLNRTGHLGPAPDKRSRGELVLEALGHADTIDSVTALGDLDPVSYRPFNMVVADNRDAYWLRHSGLPGRSGISAHEIPDGVSMLTAQDLNDSSVPRIARYLDRFRAAPQPDIADGDWSAWIALLAEQAVAGDRDPNRFMTVVTDIGYGTVSGSLLALPAPGIGKPVWLFAHGRPGQAAFRPVHEL